MIGLVACSKSKLDKPAQAQELYQGTLFKYASAYVRQVCDLWFILSAEHGLVHPEQIIEPYDITLTDKGKLYRVTWASKVMEQLKDAGLNDEDEYLLLAGKVYAEFLVIRLGKDHVKLPLAGMGIGKQISWLKEQING